MTAWTETSRAEVTSSQTRGSGSTTSARAMATRWRSPPESWSGIAARGSRRSVTRPPARRPPLSIVALRARVEEVLERLCDDLPDGLARVEGGVRVLEDVLDPPQEQPRSRSRALSGKVSALVGAPRRSSCACRPTMQRASVVLPEPDSPTTARHDSAATSETRSRTGTSSSVAGDTGRDHERRVAPPAASLRADDRRRVLARCELAISAHADSAPWPSVVGDRRRHRAQAVVDRERAARRERSIPPDAGRGAGAAPRYRSVPRRRSGDGTAAQQSPRVGMDGVSKTPRRRRAR